MAQLTLTSLDYLMFSAFVSKEEPVVVRPTGSALSLQPRWEARPVCIPPQHPGPEVSKKRTFSLAFPPPPKKKQALYTNCHQGSRAAFLSGSLGWDHPGQRSHQGMSRLADVSRVALNQLCPFSRAAGLWATTRQPFSIHFYL